MESISEFIYRNREQLLRYMDGKAPATHQDPAPLEFVDAVVAEWSSLFGGKQIQAPTQRERTFWFALYLFEEMQEVPAEHRSDPWVKIQRKNLERIRELLRNNAELPQQFYATRPGETPEGWDEEDWDDADWDIGDPAAPDTRH